MFVWIGKYLWYTINIREGKKEVFKDPLLKFKKECKSNISNETKDTSKTNRNLF